MDFYDAINRRHRMLYEAAAVIVRQLNADLGEQLHWQKF